MGMFDSVRVVNSESVMCYNTGTVFDIATGNYVFDAKGQWRLDGGFFNLITGFCGVGQTYKSTLGGSLVMRCLAIYPDSEALIMDSEKSLSFARLSSFIRHLPFGKDLEKRIKIVSNTDYDITEFFNLVKEFVEYRKKNEKEFRVESPFINLITGKPDLVWIPFFIFIDTLTEMISRPCAKMLEAMDIDEGKLKTIFMADGQQKTILLSALSNYAAKYGIVIITSAHIGSNNDIGSILPPQKQLQFFKQNERLKGVGSKYDRLTRVLVRTQAKVLQDSNRACQYPKNSQSSSEDINEVYTQIIRNKNGAGSGDVIPFIVSQSEGLLSSLTNYHMLKNNDYYGFESNNKTRQKNVLFPEITITRNTVRTDLDSSYKLRRALEIFNEIAWMKKHWNVSQLPFDFSNIYDEVPALLSSGTDPLILDLLETRGYWTYGKDEREYRPTMSILQHILPKK